MIQQLCLSGHLDSNLYSSLQCFHSLGPSVQTQLDAHLLLGMLSPGRTEAFTPFSDIYIKISQSPDPNTSPLILDS